MITFCYSCFLWNCIENWSGQIPCRAEHVLLPDALMGWWMVGNPLDIEVSCDYLKSYPAAMWVSLPRKMPAEKSIYKPSGRHMEITATLLFHCKIMLKKFTVMFNLKNHQISLPHFSVHSALKCIQFNYFTCSCRFRGSEVVVKVPDMSWWKKKNASSNKDTDFVSPWDFSWLFWYFNKYNLK